MLTLKLVSIIRVRRVSDVVSTEVPQSGRLHEQACKGGNKKRGRCRRQLIVKMKCRVDSILWRNYNFSITADDGRKESTVKRRVLKHVLNVKFLKRGNCVQCLMNRKEVGGDPVLARASQWICSTSLIKACWHLKWRHNCSCTIKYPKRIKLKLQSWNPSSCLCTVVVAMCSIDLMEGAV